MCSSVLLAQPLNLPLSRRIPTSTTKKEGKMLSVDSTEGLILAGHGTAMGLYLESVSSALLDAAE